MDQEDNILKQKARWTRFFPFIILFIILLTIYLGYRQYISFCNSEVRYSLGDIDTRFNLSDQEVKAILEDSASRWDRASGGNTFEYDPKAKLKINLIYDKRQADLDELKATVGDLNTKNQSLEEWNNSLKRMISAYDQDLTEYNALVAYWNSQGGAPTEIFNSLEAERKSLDKRRQEINKTAELLNIQVSKYNLSVDQIKNEADQNKNQLITQGMFFSKENKIDIYTFGNKEELRLVLMHELGHARGVEHASSDLSIMYAVLGNQRLEDPTPSDEDVKMLQSSCLPRIINNFASINTF